MSQPRKPGFVAPEDVDAYLRVVEPIIAEVALLLEEFGDDELERWAVAGPPRPPIPLGVKPDGEQDA